MARLRSTTVLLGLAACGAGERSRVPVQVTGCTEAEARLLVFADAAACLTEDPTATREGSAEPVAETGWLDPDAAGVVEIEVPTLGPVAVVAQCRDGDGLVQQWGCAVQSDAALRVVVRTICSNRCESAGSCGGAADEWTGGGGPICVPRCPECAADVDAGPPDAGGGCGNPCEPPPAVVDTIPLPGRTVDLARAGTDVILAASGGEGGLQVLVGDIPALSRPEPEWQDLAEAFGVSGTADHAYVAEGSTEQASENLQIVSIGADGAPSAPWGIQVEGELYDVEVQGRTLYAAAGSGGLRILDVSNPASPVEQGVATTTGDALDVALLDDRAVVAVDGVGLVVVDVSDPEAPVPALTHEAPGARSVAADPATSVVLLARGDAGVDVLDLRGGGLVLRGNVATTGEALGVTIAEGRGWVADGSGELAILDLEAALLCASVPTPGGVHAVLVEGTWALLAGGRQGLFVADVACAP